MPYKHNEAYYDGYVDNYPKDYLNPTSPPAGIRRDMVILLRYLEASTPFLDSASGLNFVDGGSGVGNQNPLGTFHPPSWFIDTPQDPRLRARRSQGETIRQTTVLGTPSAILSNVAGVTDWTFSIWCYEPSTAFVPIFTMFFPGFPPTGYFRSEYSIANIFRMDVNPTVSIAPAAFHPQHKWSYTCYRFTAALKKIELFVDGTWYSVIGVGANIPTEATGLYDIHGSMQASIQPIVWKRAITDAEVAWVWNNGLGNYL